MELDDPDARMEDAPNADVVDRDYDPPAFAAPQGASAAASTTTEVKDVQKNFKPCSCGEALTLSESYNPFILCSKCERVMHGGCSGVSERELPMPGDRAYQYLCSDCGGPSMTRSPKSWVYTVCVALWNLAHEAQRTNPNRARFFRWREDICAFLDKNWERVCFNRVRTPTWNNTVGSTLSTHLDLFESGGVGLWGLVLPTLAPWAQGQLRTDKRSAVRVADQDDPDKRVRRRPAPPAVAGATDAPSPVPTSQDALAQQPSLAAPPIAADDTALRSLSAGLLRLWYHPNLDLRLRAVVLARENSAPQMRFLSELECINDRGYRMARASHGVDRGVWYCEVELLSSSVGDAHARVGWATAMAEPQAPVGYDSFSYGLRDSPAQVFHQARGRVYGEACSRGDVIGMLIAVPNGPPGRNRPWAERVAELLRPYNPFAKRSPPTEVDRCPGSRIAFYRNGRPLGLAFENIFEGIYYPAAALYMGAAVRFNFGPRFRYPPVDEPTARPLCEVLEVLAAAREAQLREEKLKQQQQQKEQQEQIKQQQQQKEQQEQQEQQQQQRQQQQEQAAPPPIVAQRDVMLSDGAPATGATHATTEQTASASSAAPTEPRSEAAL